MSDDTRGQAPEEAHASETIAAKPAPARTNEATKTDERQKDSVLRWILETVVLVALAFLLAQGIKTFIVQPYIVPTGSMIPTIEIGDRLLAEKISYRFRDPEAGEIVVFADPTGQHPALIKRVIATEGQTVDIRDGAVWVDGRLLAEPYIHGKVTDPGTVALPVEIPADNVWLMGDNRPNSGDSRFLGPQPLTAIKGRAVVTYWPPSRIGRLE